MTRRAPLAHRTGVRFEATFAPCVAIGSIVTFAAGSTHAEPSAHAEPDARAQTSAHGETADADATGNAETADADATGNAGNARARSHSVFPALGWIATQLVPSPEIAVARGVAHFGARWQITPLLYSFGVHRGEPPLRSFLVEPVIRHSGSLELYVSPEYLAIAERGGDRWFMRPGVRAYFPLVERGDYLSCSIGTSYAIAPIPDASGLGYEVGLYSLFGVLGVQLTYAPARLPVDWIATLSFRYF